MRYKKFAELLKKTPDDREYSNFESPHSPDSLAMRTHRDNVVDHIVAHAEQQKVLHSETQLEELLKVIGIELTIEENIEHNTTQKRISLNSELTNRSDKISFLLDWENAQTTSFRILTAIIEHQMQQYMLAIDNIRGTINNMQKDLLPGLKI